MDKNKLKQEYKLLADFTGYRYLEVGEKSKILDPGWYRLQELEKIMHEKIAIDYYVCRNTLDLRFRYDFNMIMRVVTKIESLTSQRFDGFTVHIDGDCCLIQSKRRSKVSGYSKMYCGNGDKLSAVYESCVLFIEWYKTNNK